MAAAATAKKRYRTPGVVNGSLAYDFGALERQLENTGRMAPDLYSAPLEETAAADRVRTVASSRQSSAGPRRCDIDGTPP